MYLENAEIIYYENAPSGTALFKSEAVYVKSNSTSNDNTKIVKICITLLAEVSDVAELL